jgi:acyl dehydratase
LKVNEGVPAWEIGDELETRTLPPVTRLQLIKYAGASGDFNPIHTIDEAAEEAGLPGVIAHGMLTLASVGLLFSPYLEHGYVKALRARFSGMVLVGDELAIGGRVTGSEETEEGRLLAFEVYARRGEDTVASGVLGFLVYAPDGSGPA